MAKEKPISGILTRTTNQDEGLVRFPELTPHLQFHDIGEQQTLLVSESFNTLLHGHLTANLLPLLCGQRSIDEIEKKLSDRYSSAEVRSAIVSLTNKGYVVSGDHSMDRSQAAYWTTLGASPRWVEERLVDARLDVRGDDDDTGLRKKLEQTGLKIDDSDPRLLVVVCDDYLDDRLAELNERQLERGSPWLLVRPRGMQSLFGPVFHADRTRPCWTCLSYRLSNHQEVHSFLRNFSGNDAAFKPFATNTSVLDAVIGIIAAEIVKWIVLDENAPLHGQAIAIDTGTLETSKHQVMRRPQCQSCGDETMHRPDRLPKPLHLKSSPKTHHNSGGARTVAPEVTLAKYRHLISPISGVVTWLTRTTSESDSWLHVYWAGSNLAVRSRSLSSLRRSLRSKSAGKGSTREQSEVSALCEAVERYSGSFHGDEIRTRRSFTEFRDDEAVNPNDVQLFSETQLANAESINAKGHLYNVVPPRFDPNSKIDWTPVWSLTQQRHRYLPTSMLYSMPAEQRGPADLIADSNGCAAGNSLEEAILQGFYELVERDAFAIWWYNQLRVPQVDLNSFDDEFLASASNYYARYERELWVLDVTADIGIPTFVALSHQPDGTTENIIYGAGSHAHPRIAVQRAICELNQCLTWLPRPGSRDGRPMIDDPLALWWWQTARLKDCKWLVPESDALPRTFADYPKIEYDDLRDDVEYCRSLVENKNMEFLVLDQTRPDVEMPVVRVIVPGMRHFWARFAPGRLYDVPVSMGRREFPLAEAELNPAPVVA